MKFPMSTSEVRVVPVDELPWSNIARELVGAEFGVGICAILVEAEPGRGPSLHRHPYEEIFFTLEGRATFRIGDQGEHEVGPGEIVVVPAGHWHGFVNSGEGTLRQIDIHVSPSFDTEWHRG
jgi:mannose-6-phosphate isomerase-like protein (cupin superfamily)